MQVCVGNFLYGAGIAVKLSLKRLLCLKFLCGSVKLPNAKANKGGNRDEHAGSN